MFRNTILFAIACVGVWIASPQDSRSPKELERLRIPEKLMLKGKQALFMLRAEGVQIYAAEEKDGKLQWGSATPEATLLDYTTGEMVGTHSKGPTWVHADGGTLSGKMIEHDPAPNADAVQWLLLEVKSAKGGRFAKVTNIQRVDTWGGRAPSGVPTKAGETRKVRYEATYVFLGNQE